MRSIEIIGTIRHYFAVHKRALKSRKARAQRRGQRNGEMKSATFVGNFEHFVNLSTGQPPEKLSYNKKVHVNRRELLLKPYFRLIILPIPHNKPQASSSFAPPLPFSPGQARNCYTQPDQQAQPLEP
jgi:hypothetical protein